MVTDARYGELLGCHIIGQNATELINEVGLAMTLESTVHEIGETTHAHPHAVGAPHGIGSGRRRSGHQLLAGND